MRHHAEDVPVEVADACDVRASPVWVSRVGDLAVRIAVAKDDLAVLLERVKSRIVASVIAFGMGDGDREDLAGIDLGGERRILVFELEVYVFADKMQPRVSHQRPRQQPGLAQDLKAVANAKNEFAVGGKLLDGLHNGRKSGKSTGTQIVAVRKSARHDHRVITAQVCFMVPDKIDRLSDVL